MRRFQNILVYVDPRRKTRQALERGAEQAQTNEARLTLVAEVARSPRWRRTLFRKAYEAILASHQEETVQALEELAAPFRQRGISIETKVVVGQMWMELIREVLRGEHDLVIKDIEPSKSDMGILGRHRDMRLLRKCPCPVWLVKGKADRFRRIAAAIEADVEESDRHALNVKILELASSLARLEKCELHVVHAWSVYAESILRSKVSAAKFGEIRQATKDEAGQTMEALLASVDTSDITAQVHLVEGLPEEVVPTLVEQEHEDLLVMGTVARAGVAGWMTGNTAEKVLQRVNCSVLAVKPDGFECPIDV